MTKPTTELSAQDRVILFCTATGIDHAAVGILAHAMQSMVIRGFHRAQSRERGVDAHGQRTRYARRDLRERGPEITTLRLVAAARLAGRDPEEATDCAIKAW